MEGRRRLTSIKPGRGPSLMGGIGSLVAVVFGIIWTVVASRIAGFASSSPVGSVVKVFPLFGIVFILVGLANAVYNFRNATAKQRHSIIEVTSEDVEPDPLNRRFGRSQVETCTAAGADETPHDAETTSAGDAEKSPDEGKGDVNFCPYCGEPVRPDFRFCPECGRELPGPGRKG